MPNLQLQIRGRFH